MRRNREDLREDLGASRPSPACSTLGDREWRGRPLGRRRPCGGACAPQLPALCGGRRPGGAPLRGHPAAGALGGTAAVAQALRQAPGATWGRWVAVGGGLEVGRKRPARVEPGAGGGAVSQEV